MVDRNLSAKDLYPNLSDDVLQEIASEVVKRTMEEIELKCRVFIARTGLKTQECCLVYFRGQAFPQWIGAVPTRRESAV